MQSLCVKLPQVKTNVTKVLTGGESIEQTVLFFSFFFFFNKKLYVKDVKINEASIEDQREICGPKSPSFKVFNNNNKKCLFGPQLHSVFRNQFC